MSKTIVMKPIIFLFILFISANVFSQDTIYKRNGEVINAKVLEVELNVIKFKKTSNPDGPLYSLPKSQIALIQYKNGSKDIFPLDEYIPEEQTAVISTSEDQDDKDQIRPVFHVIVGVIPYITLRAWTLNAWSYCRPWAYTGR